MSETKDPTEAGARDLGGSAPALEPPDLLAKAHCITVLGLGPLGRTLAAALRSLGGNYRVLGHDREPERSRAAMAAGAIDRVAWTLRGAVEEADLLLICEGLDQALESLELAAPSLKEGALVMDCAPLKAPMLARAAAVLPRGRAFVGSHPLIAALPEPQDGTTPSAVPAAAAPRAVPTADGGRAKLPATLPAADPAACFRGRSWCICAAPDAPAQAIGTVERLIRSLGARPFIIDAAEHDALASGALLLPLLSELAFLGPVTQSPSAADLRRLGTPTVLPRLGGSTDLAEALSPLLAAEPAVLLRWLDAQVAALGDLRAALAGGEEAREAWLAAALDRLASWEQPEDGRDALDRSLAALPQRADLWQRLFGRWGRRGAEAQRTEIGRRRG